MAQAVMSIVLQRPDTARARPSSLIKRDEEYQRLFSASYPIEVYRASAQIMKQVEAYLAQHADNLSTADRNNLRFYVAMSATQESLKKDEPLISDIASLAASPLIGAVLDSSYQIVKTHYVALGPTDQTAKGATLLASIKQTMMGKYPKVIQAK
jgi:hypothetical protein